MNIPPEILAAWGKFKAEESKINDHDYRYPGFAVTQKRNSQRYFNQLYKKCEALGLDAPKTIARLSSIH